MTWVIGSIGELTAFNQIPVHVLPTLGFQAKNCAAVIPDLATMLSQLSPETVK